MGEINAMPPHFFIMGPKLQVVILHQQWLLPFSSVDPALWPVFVQDPEVSQENPSCLQDSNWQPDTK